MPTLTLHDLHAWRSALSRHACVLLFKHSPICPVSARALAEWQRFVAAHPEQATLFVDVIADRSLARGLAEECGVPHASPQAILFRAGRPVWNASHGDITVESLKTACGLA